MPATREWIEEFKIEEAKAIEEKRLAIELEAASASAEKFLQQSEDEARQVGEVEANADGTNLIPRLTSGDTPQEIPAVENPSSQPINPDSSQPKNRDSSQD